MTSFVPSALTFDQETDDDMDEDGPPQDAVQMQPTKPAGASAAQQLINAVASAALLPKPTEPVATPTPRSPVTAKANGAAGGKRSPTSSPKDNASNDLPTTEKAAPGKKRKLKSETSADGGKRTKKAASPTPSNPLVAATTATPAAPPRAQPSPDHTDEAGNSSESDADDDLLEGVKAEDVEEKLSFLEFDSNGGCLAGSGLQYYTHERQQVIQQYTQVIHGVSGSGDRLFCYDHKKVRLPQHLSRGTDGLYHCTEMSPCTNVARPRKGNLNSSRTTNRYHAPQYCANCNLPGHLPRECPNPRKFSERVCFICASSEHQMQACPNALSERPFDEDMRVGILTQQSCNPSDLAMLTCFVCLQRGHCDCSEPRSAAFLGDRVCHGRCSVCAGPHSLRDCSAIRQLIGGRSAAPQMPTPWSAALSPSSSSHSHVNQTPPRYNYTPPSPHSAPLPPRPQLTPLQRSSTLQSFTSLPPRPPALTSGPYGRGTMQHAAQHRPLAPRPPLLAPIRPYGTPPPASPPSFHSNRLGSTPPAPPPRNPYGGGAGPRIVPRTQPLAPQLPSGRFARY